MNRKSRTFSVEGVTYEAREMTYRTLCEVQRLKKSGDDAAVAGAIIAGCIYTADGKPLCESAEAAGDLPLRLIEPMASAAAEVSDLEKDGAEGKPHRRGSRGKTS